MNRFSVTETAGFKKEFRKLPGEMRARFRKQFKRLEEDPYSVGKPLGSKHFRELKNLCYRAYFVIVENEITIILVSVSKKKDQHEKINNIRDKLKESGPVLHVFGKIYNIGDDND